MRLSCACGIHGSYELFARDPDARRAFALVASIGPLGDLLMDYITLFRPGKRALSWQRVHTLLVPLVEGIKAGQIERHGRAWPAPQQAWRAAIEQMLANKAALTLPLKSHGYLFAIIAGDANAAEAAEEEEMEQQRRTASAQRPAPRADAAQQIGAFAAAVRSGCEVVSPQSRAVDALAAEIARRRAAGEPSMTHREMADWQKRKQAEFNSEAGQ